MTTVEPVESRSFEALLQACADEPIATPGSIQPHGVLLALAEPGLAVVQVSGNSTSLLGIEPAALLGIKADEALPAPLLTALRDSRDQSGAFGRVRYADAAGEARDVYLIAHRSSDLIIVELESADGWEGEDDGWMSLTTALTALQAATSIEDLTEALAAAVAGLTGFDRTMIYRFDEDWNGEVIAEVMRREDLPPFLGLRYPASDIPAQARALYARNWMRIIPDARYTPVPVFNAGGPVEPQALDLSDSVLRSVSPVHLEYLANMGVRSSMSVSLIVDGKLWGLIALHQYSGAHRPSYRVRRAAEFLARTASVLLNGKTEVATQRRALAVGEKLTRLIRQLGEVGPRSIPAGLTEAEVTQADLLPCTGAALYLDGTTYLLGATPDEDNVHAIARLLWPGRDRGRIATDSLARLLKLSGSSRIERWKDTASGVIAVPIAGTRDSFAMWFRPEVLQEVTWGGDPSKSDRVVEDGVVRLSPRHSFDAWVEQVWLTATPWFAHEVAAAEELCGQVSRQLLQRAEHDSRLTAALERAVLLSDVPRLPGVEVAVRYKPHAKDAVGGDFYDFVPLPDGRLAVVAGDVAGHGLAASGVSAELRHALRAYLLREDTTERALARLNELTSWLLPSAMATVAVLDLDTSRRRMGVTVAGHLPPLLARGDQAWYLEASNGMTLGLSAEATYVRTEVELQPGDRVLMYSDGLVERRGTTLDASLERLRLGAIGAAASANLETMSDAILECMDLEAADDDVMLIGLQPQG